MMVNIIIDAPIWQGGPVTKRLDGTFEIVAENGPYQVCPKDVDPAGLYDFDEVSVFWATLPADDPRKLTQSEPEEIIVTMDQAQASKLAEIINGSNAAEAYAKQGYTTVETGSWSEQEAGARALLGDAKNTKDSFAILIQSNEQATAKAISLVEALAEARNRDVLAFAKTICSHADTADYIKRLVWVGEQAAFERMLSDAVESGDVNNVLSLEIAYSLPPKEAQNEGS